MIINIRKKNKDKNINNSNKEENIDSKTTKGRNMKKTENKRKYYDHNKIRKKITITIKKKKYIYWQ